MLKKRPTINLQGWSDAPVTGAHFISSLPILFQVVRHFWPHVDFSLEQGQ
jgi:hypothetical protein